MVARKPIAKKGGQKKIAPKADKPKKPTPAKQPALAEQTKPMKEKTSKPSSSKKIRKSKVMKVYKGKRTDHLVDEEGEEPQPTPEIPVEDDEYNLQRGIQMSLESFQAPIGGVAIREPASGITQRLLVVEGKGKGIATDKQDASTRPFAQPQDDTSANVVHDTPSPADAEIGANMEKSNSEGDNEILNVDEERGKDVSNKLALEERTVELDEGQVGSDPGKTPESRPLPERVLIEEYQAGSNPGQSYVVHDGPNPEPMHEDFIATVYPQVHKSLKHTIEEHVYIENLLSSTGTLSSIKNLDDVFTFGDQFLNDKPTKEEPGKANVETEVESMVTVPIHQASSSAPPLSTPIIDLTPPKPISLPAHKPVFTDTTATTTTTLPLPPPPPQQSTTDPALATRVSALEKVCANFEKKHKLQDKTTQPLSSRVFTLENHDLYSKIDNYVNKTVKEGVHNALQAPIRDRFRELLEFEMKEILCDRMFKSGSYRSHPEHAALYNALEVSMDHENREELIEATAKSRKRLRDD
ncbi:hypothetical protein Tco_1039507 [Tanacetum coccineum]